MNPLVLFIPVFLSLFTLIQGSCGSCKNLKIIGKSPNRIHSVINSTALRSGTHSRHHSNRRQVILFGRGLGKNFKKECSSLYHSKYDWEYLADPKCLLKLDKQGDLVATFPNGRTIRGCTENIMELVMPYGSIKPIAVYKKYGACTSQWTQPIVPSPLVEAVKGAVCLGMFLNKLVGEVWFEKDCGKRFGGLVHKDFVCAVFKRREFHPLVLDEKKKSFDLIKDMTLRNNVWVRTLVHPRADCREMKQLRTLGWNNREKSGISLRRGQSVDVDHLGFGEILRKASIP